VVTYNRRALLAECLAALRQQTHPVQEVVVVDNGSSDGTREALERGELIAPPLRYLPLARNGGASEGEHYGVQAALEVDTDWVWVMDDDCEPTPDALTKMLTSLGSSDPATVALVPLAVSPNSEPLPLDRGSIRPRWFLAPLIAVKLGEREVEIDFSTFVGPLVRASAARQAGLPLREAFIRNEDVEYFARLRKIGRVWLITNSVLMHKPARPFTDASFAARVRDYVRPDPFGAEWKHLYALRNLVYAGRRHGFMNAGQASAYVATQAGRRLLFSERRLRSAYLAGLFGWHGWHGTFRNVPPERWGALACARRPSRYVAKHAMRYDIDPRPAH
jgi:GT2 family glycosyltransferase